MKGINIYSSLFWGLVAGLVVFRMTGNWLIVAAAAVVAAAVALLTGNAIHKRTHKSGKAKYTPGVNGYGEGYPYEVDPEEPNPEGRFAHCLVIYPELSGTSGAFTAYSVDFMSENAPVSTYWALCQWNMHNGACAYAGLQNKDGKPVSLMSFWKNDHGDCARRIWPDKKQNFFDNEGEGSNCFTSFPWKPGHWYRMVIRSLMPDETGTTVVEQWVQDKETSKWYLLCAFDTLLKDSYLDAGICLFMENFLPGDCNFLRSARIKNIAVREKGSDGWRKINKATLRVGANQGETRGGFSFGASPDYFWLYTSGSGEDITKARPDIPVRGTFEVSSDSSDPGFDFGKDYRNYSGETFPYEY